MASIESDFVEFFDECAGRGIAATDMLKICHPLIQRRRIQRAKTLAAVVCLLLALHQLSSRCDCCSWSLSALGRQLLIQVLPLWNWTPLYSARCLLEYPEETPRLPPRLSSDETPFENCLLCDDLNHIPQVFNTTFSYMETTYLERGLPVIVIDSHRTQILSDFLEAMAAETSSFGQSEPCDLSTNLMLKKRFSVEFALERMRNLNLTGRWFLQLRNCAFDAVKASRVFLRRPYYYPQHLPPFYSSWLLAAHNYALQQRDAYVHGLIIVQQLSGHFRFELSPKKPCEAMCPVASVRLAAGEALVFSTDVWSLSYAIEPVDMKFQSIATILEIDWTL